MTRTVTISEESYKELLRAADKLKEYEDRKEKLVQEFRELYEMYEPVRREACSDADDLEDLGITAEEKYIQVQLKGLGYEDWDKLFELDGVSR